MQSKWKQIWEKQKFDNSVLNKDYKSIFYELKRCDGFDVYNDQLNNDSFIAQYENINSTINYNIGSFSSLFEIGCGAGANLFLYERQGIATGGIDYSNEQIRIAKQVLKTNDLTCSEAKNTNTDTKYDIVLSNSVFSYFSNEEYALEVLDKCLNKATKGIVLIDIHDYDKYDQYVAYRRKTIENYDEKYKGLDKLFYKRKFFVDFCEKYGLEYKFEKSCFDGYWNNDFVFDCYIKL